MKKVYYQLEMHQKSPLRVGSGDGEITDSDLMLDGRGCPFIPGSSVAGVLRDLYAKRVSSTEDAVKILFGYIEGETLSDSHVMVSDAIGPDHAVPSDYFVTVRDGIKLDEWGIIESKKKYDFQVAETKQPYYSVVEWTGNEATYQTEIVYGLDRLMKMIVSDGISFGARTTRGYGRMSVTAKKKVFEFPKDIEDWLNFDPLVEGSFKNERSIEAELLDDGVTKIHIDIEIKGSFSVRVNTARAERLEDGSVPDSVPLSNFEDKPVIPGTSWAGVFRHHMLAVLRQVGLGSNCGNQVTELNHLFGVNEDESQHTRSSISFGETKITGGAPYSITRNAVERFTQAPKNTALFTNQFWQGGKGRLDISIQKRKLDKLQAQLLAIALIDLDIGLLTFGGADGTGHGCCEISRIIVNGIDVTDQLKKQDSHFLEEFI